MRALLQHSARFSRSDDGPTTTEYAVMLGLIVLACVGAVATLGDAAAWVFSSASAIIDSVPPAEA